MKRAIIVGASSGIGREVCKCLLAVGWRVGIAARREAMLLDVKSEYPAGFVEVGVIDVTADDAPLRLIELVDRVGGANLFVLSAGVGKQNPGLAVDIEMCTVAVNVKGFTCMVDTMFGYMAAHGGGHIAVISSVAGTKGLGVAPSYSATKAYQNVYIEALEQLSHIRRLNITFTDIRPGFVDTDLLAGSGRYPMLMNKEKVGRHIVRAVLARRHVCVIDWRYRILVAVWRLIPRWLWRVMRITNK